MNEETKQHCYDPNNPSSGCRTYFAGKIDVGLCARCSQQAATRCDQTEEDLHRQKLANVSSFLFAQNYCFMQYNLEPPLVLSLREVQSLTELHGKKCGTVCRFL